MRMTFGMFSLCMFKVDNFSQLEQFVSASSGKIIGEDAEVYAEFWVLELIEEFGTSNARIGIIVERQGKPPYVIVDPSGRYLAIGFNRSVAIIFSVDLIDVRIIALDGAFFCFLCGCQVFAAVHELGAVVLGIPDAEVKASVFCEIVSYAELSDTELILKSMSGDLLKIAIFNVS